MRKAATSVTVQFPPNKSWVYRALKQRQREIEKDSGLRLPLSSLLLSILEETLAEYYNPSVDVSAEETAKLAKFKLKDKLSVTITFDSSDQWLYRFLVCTANAMRLGGLISATPAYVVKSVLRCVPTLNLVTLASLLNLAKIGGFKDDTDT